jgi:hypothetical protein
VILPRVGESGVLTKTPMHLKLWGVARRRYVVLSPSLSTNFAQNLLWIHRRFIVTGYADRDVQDKGLTLHKE